MQNRRGSGSIASLLMAENEEAGPAMTTEGKPLKEYVESFETMLIDNTMRRHKGSITAVMDELCLPRRTLNEKMAKYGLSARRLRLSRRGNLARTAPEGQAIAAFSILGRGSDGPRHVRVEHTRPDWK